VAAEHVEFNSEPQNWLMYGADYFSQRYSGLTQITPANVKNLSMVWAYQSWPPEAGSHPLVVDGISESTQRRTMWLR
jgi:glucose dehydrogenase